jgi:hypothetical protein
MLDVGIERALAKKGKYYKRGFKFKIRLVENRRLLCLISKGDRRYLACGFLFKFLTKDLVTRYWPEIAHNGDCLVGKRESVENLAG